MTTNYLNFQLSCTTNDLYLMLRTVKRRYFLPFFNGKKYRLLPLDRTKNYSKIYTFVPANNVQM
jgi:hypothetical protein